jgi:hypothetical protein
VRRRTPRKRRPNPWGWCGVCRAEACTTDHGGPLIPCLDCEMDWPTDRMSDVGTQCELCRSVTSSMWWRKQYATSEAFRKAHIARSTAYWRRNRRKHNEIKARRYQSHRKARVFAGWAEPTELWSRGGDHKGRIVVACGTAQVGPLPARPVRRLEPCSRCLSFAGSLVGATERPAFGRYAPVVELEATA